VIPEMLWIIGFYVAAAASVHALHGRIAGNSGNKRHYVLVAGNHQLKMEWYVRALRYLSRRTGMEIGITVVLENGSDDDTGSIVELFAREDSGIDWVRSSSVNGVNGEIDDIGGNDGNEPYGEEATRRERMIRQLESSGKVASSGQVVWVDLANEEELQRLPF